MFQQQRKLLMIPGPTEFDPAVLNVLGEPSPSHVAPSFISEFSDVLKSLRKILYANEDCQPFVLSGGGSLGWDCIVSSLCDSSNNERALIINTGYFSDNFSVCCQRYGIVCDEIKSEVGNIVTPEMLNEYLNNKKNNNESLNYRLICITHVDTSTAIVNPINELVNVISKYCNMNETLISVDGVCSFAGEKFYFSDWNIDACMTASQKALGCPPGLSILMLSGKAINLLKKRKDKVKSFYCDLNNWLPIMQKYEAKQPSYFSTPNTNLIRALNVSCNKLLAIGMEKIFSQHYKLSNAFKDGIEELGLEFVPKERKFMANTLTAVRFPKDVNGKELLKYINEAGVIFAGGLHKDIKTEYFRVGHMGISVNEGCNDLLKSMQALEYALQKVNYQFKSNIGVNTLKNLVTFNESNDEKEENNVCNECNHVHPNVNENYYNHMMAHNMHDHSHDHSHSHGGLISQLEPIARTSFYTMAGVALGYLVSIKLPKK